MPYYHCSPVSGLKSLQPNQSLCFEEKHAVHLTTLLPMALIYGIRDFEYAYRFHFEGGKPRGMYYDEAYPGALIKLYKGKGGFLYVCADGDCQTTQKPFEYISFEPVSVLGERRVPDLPAAFLDLEQKGELDIIRFQKQSRKSFDFYRRMQKEVVRKHNLLDTPGPCADYIGTACPDSWYGATEEAELQ